MFAVDIDSTIAFPDRALARFHNADLQLGIPEHQLARIATYEDFLKCPETQHFLAGQSYPGKALQDARKRVQRLPAYAASLDVMYGAVQALQGLAKQDRINYYTARDVCVKQATQTWLRQHQFPYAPVYAPVVYCYSTLDKLVKLYEHEQGSSELIMFIDNRWQQLLEAYHGLAQGRYKEVVPNWSEIAQFVKERVIIVGFGATQADVNFTPVLPVKALPSWEKIDTFVDLFHAILQ
jgi:hypothetical protein